LIELRPLEKYIKLSDLSAKIKRTIDDAFESHAFWVVADVTNHTFKSANNFHYFELVEKDMHTSKILAKLPGRAWGTGSMRIARFEATTGQKFRNNVHVLLQVVVQYTTGFGLQLNILDIDSSFTLGLFEQQRLATLESLILHNAPFISRVGSEYLTRNKELALRPVLQNLAILSSDTSAGFQDFSHTIENNLYHYKFNINPYFTAVQGEGNAKNLVAKLIEIYKSGKQYDAIVLIRGGGAQTDFFIFDNYDLARAVAKFPIPIITGIGHQKNETICDMMAHTSLKTPTKAAEFIIATNRAFEERLILKQKRVIITAQQILHSQHNKLFSLKSYFVNDVLKLIHNLESGLARVAGSMLSIPKLQLLNKDRKLAQLRKELFQSSEKFLKQQESKVMLFQTMVRLMDPEQILKKGFALIRIGNKVINSAEEIAPGTEITIIRQTEELSALVNANNKK
jgi:exodeoxyribonuclease VII large subunit